MNYDTFDHKHEFAGLLRNVIRSLSWSQSTLGKHVGVSRQLIGVYCGGTTLPSVEIIEKLILLFEEYGVNERIIQEILRHYIVGIFPESAAYSVKKYLWEKPENSDYVSPECVMLQHLYSNSKDASGKFFNHLMDIAGGDCCCIFRRDGVNYTLAEHFHFSGISLQKELESVGREYFNRWLHTLVPGTVLELEIDRDLSQLQCRSTKFHNGCFAFLTGVQPEGMPREAVAMLYINHHPAYKAEKIKLLLNAVKFWKMHRERFAIRS